MASTPAFAATPKAALAQVSAANTNRDGTGTIVTVLTAGANGTRIERVKVKAVGATTAGMIRLYLNDGTNTRLLEEALVAAVTPSGIVETFEAEFDFSRPDQMLVLPNGWTLRASTHVAETFNVIAIGADL
jgi:hypothetical protein